MIKIEKKSQKPYLTDYSLLIVQLIYWQFIDIDVVMPMYNVIEYTDYYSKISGSLWKYYRD